METNSDERRILIIDDDPGDQKLIIRAIKKIDPSIHVISFNNSEEAISYANSKDSLAKNLQPHLVLLDLNLPKINGIEVLKIFKKHKNLKSTPVVILTTSNAEADVNKCYEEFAGGYIRKPATFGQLTKLLKVVLEYWLRSCILPTKEANGFFKTTKVDF